MKKLYFVLNKISDIICKILCALAFLVVVANFGSVLLQVVNRYIIVKISDLSFPWTEEMARYSMIWLCYLVIPVVYREGSMAQLDIIYDRLGKKGRMFLYLVTRLLCMIFIVLAVYHGIHVIQTRMIYKSPILQAPGYLLYSAPVFGCSFMAFEIITELIGVLAGVLTPFPAGAGRQLHGSGEKGDDSK